MRRTDEAFKAEVFRRCEEYRIRRRKRRKIAVVLCMPLLLCGGLMMMLASMGFGGSTDTADAAYSMNGAVNNKEYIEDPAAAAQEPALEEGYVTDGSSASDCVAVVLSIEIISQPELEEYTRIFTEPEKMYAIMDAIQAFYDDPDTVPGGSEVGDCEGMTFRIIVTEESITREYILFNNALTIDGDESWLINPGAYQTLLELIQKTAD